MKGEVSVLKWITIIICSLFLISAIKKIIKSDNKKMYIRNLPKSEKGIYLVIIVGAIIYISSMVIQNCILNSNIKKTIEETKLYQYVDNYDISGYKGATVTLKANDDFINLEDMDKLKITKEVYDNVDSTILSEGNIDDTNVGALVSAHKVIINTSEGQYNYKGWGLKKPNGEEIREEVKNSTSNSSTSSNNNYSSIDNNISEDRKGELLAIAQSEIKKRLKSPKSADFKWGYDNYTFKTCESTTSGYIGYIVGGKVSAKNSFNAELENTFAIQFEVSGNKYKVIDYIIQ